MEPISHTALVMMLKHAINRHGLSLYALCRQADLSEEELTGVLSSSRYCTPRMMAKLANAFMLDWSGIWARYAHWRYLDEARRVSVSQKRHMLSLNDDSRPAYQFELAGVAKQIIQESPEKSAQLLAEEIHRGLALDMKNILSMIAQVRSGQTGDYRYD